MSSDILCLQKAETSGVKTPRVSYAFDKVGCAPKYWVEKFLLGQLFWHCTASVINISPIYQSGVVWKAGFWVNTDKGITASSCLEALNPLAFSHL